MNYKMIRYTLGFILLFESLFLLLPSLVAIIYKEKELAAFTKQSQISQAEAKKYFIEKFRIGKGKRSGIIWWNLLDGWPQFSDAVVDYYYRKKIAYEVIVNSQRTVALMFREPENGILKLLHPLN